MAKWTKPVIGPSNTFEALEFILAMIEAADAPVDDAGKAIVPMTCEEADELIDDIYSMAETTLQKVRGY